MLVELYATQIGFIGIKFIFQKSAMAPKKFELKIGAKIKKFTSFHFVIIMEMSIADWKFIPLVYDFHTVAPADFR